MPPNRERILVSVLALVAKLLVIRLAVFQWLVVQKLESLAPEDLRLESVLLTVILATLHPHEIVPLVHVSCELRSRLSFAY